MLNVRVKVGGTLLIGLLGVSAPSMAADENEQGEDCGYAVDMADEHDFEAFHNCHEDSGLNRFLKDAFKSRKIKTKQATTVSSGKVIAPQAPAVVDQTNAKAKKSDRQQVAEPAQHMAESARRVAVTQPLRSLQKPLMEQMASRYALLLELAEICAHGFAVESEEYRPVEDKGLSLFLNYRCLDAQLALDDDS